jgi:hypothetical protein
VTIAIGLIASDGILIATDREESDPYQKIDQGKVKGSYVDVPPYNSLIISGSRRGSYVDVITDHLIDWFRNDTPSDLSLCRDAIRSRNKQFYEEHVLPLALYSADDRPDYDLLISSKIGEEKGLWTTDALVLNPKIGYAAVGAGAITARTLLQKVYAFVPTISAINLAVYVIGEVKRQVPGCGLDTDVIYACHDYKPDKIVGEETREIEDALRGFDRILQRANFHRYIGSDLSLDPRTKPDDVKKQTETIESKFRELNDKRITHLNSRRQQ